jgi:hypothetical protein
MKAFLQSLHTWGIFPVEFFHVHEDGRIERKLLHNAYIPRISCQCESFHDFEGKYERTNLSHIFHTQNESFHVHEGDWIKWKLSSHIAYIHTVSHQCESFHDRKV